MPVTPESAPGMVKALPNAGIRNGNSVVDGPCLRRRSRDAPSRSHGRCCCLSRAGSAPPTDFQPAGYPRKRNGIRRNSTASPGQSGARRRCLRKSIVTRRLPLPPMQRVSQAHNHQNGRTAVHGEHSRQMRSTPVLLVAGRS